MTAKLCDLTVTWKRAGAPDETDTVSGVVLERLLAYALIVAPGTKMFDNPDGARGIVETELEGLAAICWGLAEHEPGRADLDTRAIFWTLSDMIQRAYAALRALDGLNGATVTLPNGTGREWRRPEGAL